MYPGYVLNKRGAQGGAGEGGVVSGVGLGGAGWGRVGLILNLESSMLYYKSALLHFMHFRVKTNPYATSNTNITCNFQ